MAEERSDVMFGPNIVEILRSIQKWGKFVGWLTIISGSLSALFGLFAFVIGAVPGVITIFLGIFLVKVAASAEILTRQYEETQMEELLLNIGKYLKLQGILIIVSLAFVLLGLIVYGALIVALISGNGYM